jgi:hypothetical protein
MMKRKSNVGRTPWSAADAHVGLFVLLTLPDQGVQRGRGRPPHQGNTQHR